MSNKKDALDRFVEEIQTKEYEPYTTGLDFFDKDLMQGGLIRKTLTILLAAQGAGKTALASQICEAIAEKQKRPVLYVNLEMSSDQMRARSISGRTTQAGCKVSALDVMQGYRWTDEQRTAILESVEDYRANVYPYLKYYDGNSAKMEDVFGAINTAAEKYKAEGKEAPAVVIDYLHLLDGAGEDQQIIKQAVVWLKNYAIRNSTIVIAISATNRDSNKAGRVTAASGRDTSGIEYTGDYLLGLNYWACEQPAKKTIPGGNDEKSKKIDNPDYVNPEDSEAMGKLLQQDERRMILRVLKGRFIPAGRAAELLFYAPAARFYGTDKGTFIPTDINHTPFGGRGIKKV